MDNYASSGLENKGQIPMHETNNVQNVGLYSSSAVPSVRDYCSATGADKFVKAGPVQSMIIPKSELTPQPKQSGGYYYQEGTVNPITGTSAGHGIIKTGNHSTPYTVSDSTNKVGGKSKRRSRRTFKNMKKRMSSKRKSMKKYKGAGRKSMKRKSMKRKSMKRKSMKGKSMKYKSMKKSMKSKRFNLQRKISNYTKGIKNKTKKIKLNFKKRRSYRGGNSTPMFIQEFNTKLSPDESMLALPTPLTRTIRNCNPLN